MPPYHITNNLPLVAPLLLRLCIRPRQQGHDLRPVPRDRRPNVARFHNGPVLRPVFLQLRGPRQGPSDAGSLRLPGAQLAHHQQPVDDAAATGCGGGDGYEIEG